MWLDVAASGAPNSTQTVVGVINATHIDQRRRLLPADYAVTPADFGVVASLRFRVPEGGDRVSMHVAIEQHRAVCAWFSRNQRPTAATLCSRFGMSRAVFSRTINGKRWAGGTVSAALMYATHEPRDPSP